LSEPQGVDRLCFHCPVGSYDFYLRALLGLSFHCLVRSYGFIVAPARIYVKACKTNLEVPKGQDNFAFHVFTGEDCCFHVDSFSILSLCANCWMNFIFVSPLASLFAYILDLSEEQQYLPIFQVITIINKRGRNHIQSHSMGTNYSWFISY